jgi:hypothetical protein
LQRSKAFRHPGSSFYPVDPAFNVHPMFTSAAGEHKLTFGSDMGFELIPSVRRTFRNCLSRFRAGGSGYGIPARTMGDIAGGWRGTLVSARRPAVALA